MRIFWSSPDLSRISYRRQEPEKPSARQIRALLSLAVMAEIIAGVALIILWWVSGLTAGGWFGLALLVAYPVLLAHIVALGAGVRNIARLILRPKKLGRALVCSVLERQVKKLQRKHDFKVVAVVGSVGKTSTKMAIASTLGTKLRVRYQSGNYNDRVTVPLVFFGRSEPSIMDITAWLRIFRQNRRALKGKYPYDVVVVELGTDGPGFMAEFDYLKIDIAVVTAITPEHMEYFRTMDAVAAEELTVFDFADAVLVNGDDIPAEYLDGREYDEYSILSGQAQYFGSVRRQDISGQAMRITLPGKRSLAVKTAYVGEPGARFTVAAAAVADKLGLDAKAITTAISRLEPFAGRMQLLKGIKASTLVDDTYNASPVAVEAALDVMYAAKAKQRIAILGSMNELGDYSPHAHREVGAYCDPAKLDLVVTIGADANEYLAPIARERGCRVEEFTSPYDAGTFVKDILVKDAIVLAKGSQNRVFAEEALKALLADPADSQKLVRQSRYWLDIKRKQFTD